MKLFTKYILICILIQSCTATNFNRFIELEYRWKKDIMLNLSGRYVDYINIRPRDSIHNYELDMYNKFIYINRYPFGLGFNKLKNEIESKKISFDSIICLTTQTSTSFDPEYLHSNYYYTFNKGKIINVFIYEPELLEFKESDDTLSNLKEMFLVDDSKTDGDGLSLLIFTKIKQDWEFEISKIIINSY